MDEKEKKFEEVREIIFPKRIARPSHHRVLINKQTGQFSLKIPKSTAERAGLNKKSVAHIILFPNETTFKNSANTELMIYFDEVMPDEEETKKANKRQSKNNN